MRTLVAKGSIAELGGRFPPPQMWVKHLNENLPACGEVTSGASLVKVVGGDGQTIIDLAAKDVCSEERLREFGRLPPDGMWEKWGDTAVDILNRLLFKRLDETLIALGREEDVPPDWRIVYGWPKKEELEA